MPQHPKTKQRAQYCKYENPLHNISWSRIGELNS
jgi:hypothetical protein